MRCINNMRIPVELTYEDVEERHPQQLINLICKLRNSSSVMRYADPKHFVFEYQYAMRVEGMSGTEFLNRAVTGKLPKPKLDTVEAKVKDWLERATPVRLHAKMGRWNGSEEVPNPPELEQSLIKDAEKELEREKYYASLTKEDRNKEMKRLLNQLSADGLVGIVME